MKVMRMPEREQLIADATASTIRASELLAAAGDYPALPYLKAALAILRPDPAPRRKTTNAVAMEYLRMALVLLDDNGEVEAAGDVEEALMKLGEEFPELDDLEASARMDWWMSRRG